MARYRFMRIIIIFDLPVGTKEERKQAAGFRRSLIKDGFYMMQFSIYGRLCNGNNDVKKHLNRIGKNLPSKGSVRAIVLTEQQYTDMKLLLGTKTEIEKAYQSNQLTIF